MSYTKEKFEKLPKWAQSEIKELKSIIEEQERRLSEFHGVSESNTYLVDGLSLSSKPLPNNARIKFYTGKDKLNYVEVYVNNQGVVDINCGFMGEMVLLPRAAGRFSLTFVERQFLYTAYNI